VTDVADYLSFFADDAETDVILLYLEGINDGPRFLYAARRAYAAGKTVVALKVGGTREGAGAVATHTAVLSGSAEATSAAFRAAGVIEAEDPAQLVDAALLAMHRRADAPIPGKRVGIVTISGGAGVLLTDQLIRRAFDVARSSPPTREALASFLPSFAGLNNPVDVTANVMHQPETFGRAVTVVAEDPSIDQVVVVPGTLQTDEFSAVLAAAQHSTGKPLIAVNMAGSQRVGLSLRSHGIPVFDDYSRCTNAMQLLANARPPEDIVVSGDSASLPAISAGTAGVLSEAASKAIVAATGVAIPCGTVVIGEDEAVAAAERLGYPVVLKLHGADVFHKSDVQGVHLQLADPAAVRAAFRALRAMGSGPEVLVEQQLSRPVAECLLAIRADSVFGSVLVFGAGGVLAELIQDVTAALCPVSRATAEAMLGRTRMGRLLGGIRGRPAGDVEALLEAMQNFSTLGPLLAGRAEVIEINPLLVFELGRGVAAVDARVSQGVQGSG
jgi:acyl-CoA synthetase (NDP forming)